MVNFEIDYPSSKHRSYIESVYNFCKDNECSMILKGSLAKGKATKFSDIDLIVLGNIDNSKVDEIITLYGVPVMSNLLENPKGMISMIYEDNLLIDLDIRETISEEDLIDSKVLLRYDTNFIINDKMIIRKKLVSSYLTIRPSWYWILRVLHRGIIKYLTNKHESAFGLLSEIKDRLILLKITDLKFNNNFEDDVKSVFSKVCEEFEIDYQIKVLFDNLFKEFSLIENQYMKKSKP